MRAAQSLLSAQLQSRSKRGELHDLRAEQDLQGRLDVPRPNASASSHCGRSKPMAMSVARSSSESCLPPRAGGAPGGGSSSSSGGGGGGPGGGPGSSSAIPDRDGEDILATVVRYLDARHTAAGGRSLAIHDVPSPPQQPSLKLRSIQINFLRNSAPWDLGNSEPMKPSHLARPPLLLLYLRGRRGSSGGLVRAAQSLLSAQLQSRSKRGELHDLRAEQDLQGRLDVPRPNASASSHCGRSKPMAMSVARSSSESCLPPRAGGAPGGGSSSSSGGGGGGPGGGPGSSSAIPDRDGEDILATVVRYLDARHTAAGGRSLAIHDVPSPPQQPSLKLRSIQINFLRNSAPWDLGNSEPMKPSHLARPPLLLLYLRGRRGSSGGLVRAAQSLLSAQLQSRSERESWLGIGGRCGSLFCHARGRVEVSPTFGSTPRGRSSIAKALGGPACLVCSGSSRSMAPARLRPRCRCVSTTLISTSKAEGRSLRRTVDLHSWSPPRGPPIKRRSSAASWPRRTSQRTQTTKRAKRGSSSETCPLALW